jgi:hypothetical protein
MGPWVGMSSEPTGAFASLAELTRFQWARRCFHPDSEDGLTAPNQDTYVGSPGTGSTCP